MQANKMQPEYKANIHTKSRHSQQRHNTPLERRRPILRIIQVVVKVDILQSVIITIAVVVAVCSSGRGVVLVMRCTGYRTIRAVPLR